MYLGEQIVLMQHMESLNRTELIVDSTHLTYLRQLRQMQFYVVKKSSKTIT